jgi:hypothetical protein
MKKPVLLLLVMVLLGGCAAGSPPPKAIYAIAKQDRYSGVNATRDYFRENETPCVKISGYGNSTFSYKLYKEGILEAVDSGTINKSENNEILTCWKSLPAGHYGFQIFDSSGSYVNTIKFSIGK